jgi:FKBP-type peptidyl-prolyl cis-trans isomerase FkpA
MKYALVVLFSILLMSCSSDSPKSVDYVAKNEKDIADFVAKNNLNAIRSKSGLYYVINDPGTGVQPSITSNVTVAYKGYFLNGSVFDQNDGATFDLHNVIPGWTEGISYFKEGGSGILLIPASLAYGNYDNNGIPGGSVLVFVITLIKVN